MDTILGLFSGAGIVLLWEAILRPQFTKRKVARVLAIEVAELLGALEEIKAVRQRDPTILRLGVSTTFRGFEAVKDELGTLPIRSIQRVLQFYNGTEVLADVAKDLDTSDPEAVQSILFGDFHRIVDNLISEGDELLDILESDGLLLGLPSLKHERVATATASADALVARFAAPARGRR